MAAGRRTIAGLREGGGSWLRSSGVVRVPAAGWGGSVAASRHGGPGWMKKVVARFAELRCASWCQASVASSASGEITRALVVSRHDCRVPERMFVTTLGCRDSVMRLQVITAADQRGREPVGPSRSVLWTRVSSSLSIAQRAGRRGTRAGVTGLSGGSTDPARRCGFCSPGRWVRCERW